MSQVINRGLEDGSVSNAKVATGIDAAKLADGSVSNTEFQYINTLSSNAQTQINAKISSSEKGAASGVAPLNGSSKIDATYLPSYVDDVEEYANFAAFPGTGETGKIYVAIDTGYIYRWSGSIYVQIAVGSAVPVSGKENLTLDATDITNQYKDLAQVIKANSLVLVFNGLVQRETTDYTVSLTGGAGGKTRVSFVAGPGGDLGTGGASELVDTDVLNFQYLY